MPDDLWSQGKCGLKTLQYGAAGLPVVTNPVGVHPSMVVDGVTGFLATTPGEWAEAVRTLRDDPSRRDAMGRAARRAVEEGYSVAAWSESFVAAVAGTPTLGDLGGHVSMVRPRTRGLRPASRFPMRSPGTEIS